MKNKTNLIFIHKLLKAFADSMLSFFIPLIVLKESGEVSYMLLYLILHYSLIMILNLVLKKFLQKYGIVAMILHIVPIIVLQFVVSLCPMTIWITILVSVLSAFYKALYSVPLNLLFVFSDKDANVAKFQIATNIGKIIFIVISGYVLGSNTLNSTLILTIVGTVFYIFSIIPILYGYKLLKETYNEIAKKPETSNKKGYLLFNIFHIAFSLFQLTIDTILPIYLFMNNLTFETVSIIIAGIEICKIFSNLFAKFLQKKGLSIASVVISVSVFVITTILIITIKIPVILYICSCLISVSFPLIFVPCFNAFCKKVTEDSNQFDGMLYRDVYIFLPRPFLFLPYLIYPNFIVQFIIGIACSITMGVSAARILKKKNNESSDTKLAKNLQNDE